MPKLKTPTLMQALMLPFYKVPERNGVTPNWNNQPHLQQLKTEILYSSIAMLVLPFSAFFFVQKQQWLIEEYGEHKTNALAAVTAVFTVQIIIFVICVIKYWEDLILCVRGEGHIPYEEKYREEAKYFQSEQYQYDLQKSAQIKL